MVDIIRQRSDMTIIREQDYIDKKKRVDIGLIIYCVL